MLNAEPGSAGVPPASGERAGDPHAQLQLRHRLETLGFDDVRFAAIPAGSMPPLREWLVAGMQADMQWIDRSAEKRLDPTLVLPGARSIIMLGVSYWSGQLATRPLP